LCCLPEFNPLLVTAWTSSWKTSSMCTFFTSQVYEM
jgi:hypothetical protein